MDTVVKFSIQRVTKEGKEEIEDVVTMERPLTIILNNRELVTLLCSPADLNYLAIGFLSSEGFIKNKNDLKQILVDAQRGVVRVETQADTALADELIFKRLITSGCGRGASFYSAADVQGQTKIASQLCISTLDVFALVKEFQSRSEVYKLTGGVHSAALCDPARILVFAEDIGRHNAIDKIFGRCLLEDLPTNDHLLITSGRVSSEMLLKTVRGNIPVVISKSAPTDLGVKFANELGITLIGFVRGGRMNVYTHDWRVVVNYKD